MEKRASLRVEKRLQCAWSVLQPLMATEFSASESVPGGPWRTPRQTAWIRDVSRSGCFVDVSGARIPRNNAQIELRLALPYGEVDPLRALAEVARADGDRGFAARFLQPSRLTDGWLSFIIQAEIFDSHRRLFL